MSNASSVVPFMSSGSLVFDQLRLSDENRQVLNKGLNYLKGPEVEEWLEKRKGDLEKIVRTAQESAKVQGQLMQVGQNLRDANDELGIIEDERKTVEANESEENKAFEEANQGLSEELEQVKDGLRDANKIALFAFNNPLTSKAGRLVASIGRYTFDASVAVLGVLHRDTLAQNCSQVLSATVTTASQCASTVAQSSVYIPLLIAGGLTYLCHKAYTVGTRIMKQQRKAEELQRQMDDNGQKHNEKVRELSGQKQHLTDRNAEKRSVIEQSEKARAELDQQRNQNESFMGKIRASLMGDIGDRALVQVKDSFNYPPEIAEKVGARAMQTFFDTMLVTYSEQRQNLASIGASDAPAMIKDKD